jgi:phage regulator Rha-like protein
MDSGLIIIKGEELLVGTWKLSKGFGVEHRSLKRLVDKYKSEFETFGFITTPLQQIDKKNRGRQIEEYLLNEPQATYLTTLLTNNETVRAFKLFLTSEFFKQRKLLQKILIQRQNAEWNEKRALGKPIRRLETDIIQQFIEYAKGQGSSNSEKYYVLLTKMENKTLLSDEILSLKSKNLRDLVSSTDLDKLKTADLIISKALNEVIEKNLNYKEGYKLAKERIEMFELLIGKTPIKKIMDKHESR